MVLLKKNMFYKLFIIIHYIFFHKDKIIFIYDIVSILSNLISDFFAILSNILQRTASPE